MPPPGRCTIKKATKLINHHESTNTETRESRFRFKMRIAPPIGKVEQLVQYKALLGGFRLLHSLPASLLVIDVPRALSHKHVGATARSMFSRALQSTGRSIRLACASRYVGAKALTELPVS